MSTLNNPFATLQVESQVKASPPIPGGQQIEHQFFSTLTERERAYLWEPNAVSVNQAELQKQPVGSSLRMYGPWTFEGSRSSVYFALQGWSRNTSNNQLETLQNPIYEILREHIDAEYVDLEDHLAPMVHESVEMNWLVHNSEMLTAHRGEWLLIDGRVLLAHSPDFAMIRTAIRERGIRSPFVYYVPRREESNSISI